MKKPNINISVYRYCYKIYIYLRKKRSYVGTNDNDRYACPNCASRYARPPTNTDSPRNDRTSASSVSLGYWLSLPDWISPRGNVSEHASTSTRLLTTYLLSSCAVYYPLSHTSSLYSISCLSFMFPHFSSFFLVQFENEPMIFLFVLSTFSQFIYLCIYLCISIANTLLAKIIAQVYYL